MTRIFISYRRKDSKPWSDRMYPVLVKAFGKRNVFKDVVNIGAGQNFRAVIERAVFSADVVLIVIGQQWVTITDKTGQKRLENPDDFVRLEAEMALRHGKIVIPVLIDGTQMPSSTDLPSTLINIPSLNGANVRGDPDFDPDMRQLILAIRKQVGREWGILAITGAVITVLLIAGFALLNRPPILTQTDITNTQLAVVALETANVIATETRTAADQTATATQWKLTPTIDSHATALAQLAKTNAIETQRAISLTAIAANRTATPTSNTRAVVTDQIAFRSNSNIYLMNADGSNQSDLTNSQEINFAPAWSPDGSQIAFTSDRDGNNGIYVMNANGLNLHKITNDNTIAAWPAWSPDGRRIVFVFDHDNNSEIYVMNTDGSNFRSLTNNLVNDFAPAWSPDGSQIAFTSNRDGNNGIYIINANGSNLHKITNDNTIAAWPAWSPDGRRIAFVFDHDNNSEIYVMNADGSNFRSLTNNLVNDFSPAWSPDGSQIAFTSNRDGNNRIYVMDADGSNPHYLINDTANDSSPAWRPSI
jgi:TIR domain/WD40-like Beta Propeller Repeat